MSTEPEDQGEDVGDKWLETLARMKKPKPLKKRWLCEWQASSMKAACEVCEVSLNVVAAWGYSDPAFAEAKAMVEQALADEHEDALDGLARGDRPGNAVQLAAITLRLRGLRPGRYRDNTQRVELTGAGGGAVKVEEEGSASRAVEMLTRFAAARLALAPPVDGAQVVEGEQVTP
jgi:hypothetical protein